MKTGLFFTLTTGGLSILLLLISIQFMNHLSDETTSYLFWFFIICAVIGAMIFPFAVLLVRPLSIAAFWKALIYLALELVILNFPGGAQDNHWVTIDTVKDLVHPKPDAAPDFTLSVGLFHLVPLLASILAMLIFRKRLFQRLPAISTTS